MNSQMQLEAKARVTDPDTSHQAAQSVTGVTETQATIYTIISAFGPVTDERIKQIMDTAGYAVSPSSARSRRAELVVSGHVEAASVKGESALGNPSTRWQVTR